MMQRLPTTLLCCVSLMAFCGARALAQDGTGETAVYALHIGVNQPPEGIALKGLRYADDDAVRFSLLTSSYARQVVVATVLDETSRKRHGDRVQTLLVPTRHQLDETIARFAVAMQRSQERGERVVFFLTYSGHGYVQGNQSQLVILDGSLDRAWLENAVHTLPADDVHLVIDACHAQGLLAARGLREIEGKVRQTTAEEEHQVLLRPFFEKNPHVGALVASAQGEQTFEWSVLESGVFTHEVLSALSGAADINADGIVAYSEIAAFLSAANRQVADTRFVAQIHIEPPKHDPNVAVIDTSWRRDTAQLLGPARRLGHFYLENNKGIRLLDAHLDQSTGFAIDIPSGEPLWLHSEQGEVRLQLQPGQRVDLSTLQFSPPSETARGNLTEALRRGLFAAPYGVSYYLGWVDSKGMYPVVMPPEHQSSQALHEPDYIPTALLGSLAAAGAVATLTFSALAFLSYQDWAATNLQRPAKEAETRFYLFEAATGTAALVAMTAGFVGWLLWPSQSAPAPQ